MQGLIPTQDLVPNQDFILRQGLAPTKSLIPIIRIIPKPVLISTHGFIPIQCHILILGLVSAPDLVTIQAQIPCLHRTQFATCTQRIPVFLKSTRRSSICFEFACMLTISSRSFVGHYRQCNNLHRFYRTPVSAEHSLPNILSKSTFK